MDNEIYNISFNYFFSIAFSLGVIPVQCTIHSVRWSKKLGLPKLSTRPKLNNCKVTIIILDLLNQMNFNVFNIATICIFSKKMFATQHLFLPVTTSLLCNLNLGLKLSLNAEPTHCSLHSLHLIR